MPTKTVEVPDLAKSSVAASKPCENYGWAAIVREILLHENAKVEERAVLIKTDPAQRCLTAINDYAALAQSFERDYFISAGQRLYYRTNFSPGAPTSIDPLIVSLRDGHPLALIWKSHSYLLYGLTYDEVFTISGTSGSQAGPHYFYVVEFKLLDPLVPPGKSGRTVTYVRDRDDPRDINGIMSITVDKSPPR